MQTTAGSWSLLGNQPDQDAHVVSLLHKSGAIIVGHSNMSEWASVRSRQYSTGYSPRGGQTRNPYDLSSSPYGSSSGSAVAVSANIVPVAFGTETDTSIIGPASTNGVVGIKPTVGLTSRRGVIPISRNLDSVGSFGRTVADAVHGLDAIVGHDPHDSQNDVLGEKQEKNYSQFLSTKDVLRGTTFGVPQLRCWQLVPEELRSVAKKVLDAMESWGARIIQCEIPSAEERIDVDGGWNW